jgi:hypothetical protein
MDDTLPPQEVKEMGQQVAESQYAQDLVERIHRVTRQRRLTVPSGSGPEGVDPNLVAEYIDNTLTPEQVAEFEKKCLTSDVHLAEVASVHQILSLIGQRAKVPDEARARMHRLIRGPESTRRSVPRRDKPSAPAKADVVDWSPKDLPQPSFWERFGPPLAVLGLIAALGVSAWQVVGPGGVAGGGPQVVEMAPSKTKAKTEPEPPPPSVVQPEPPPDVEPPLPPRPGPLPPEPENKGEAATKSMAPLPPEALGQTDAEALFLLRWNPDAAGWERIGANVPLLAGQRILNLNPYRTPIQVGPHRIDLVGETDLRLGRPADDGAPRVELLRGRLVLRESSVPTQGIDIALGDASPAGGGPGFLRLVASGNAIGLERLPWPGKNAPARLAVSAERGRVSLETAGMPKVFEAPTILHLLYAINPETGTLAARPPRLTETEETTIPRWVGEVEAEPTDVFAGNTLLKELDKEPEDPLTALMRASSHPQAEIRELAFAGLGALGDLDAVVQSLSGSGNRPDRLTAIRVLRGIQSRGPDGVPTVKDALDKVGGKDAGWAGAIQQLLIGYDPADPQSPSKVAELVALLDDDDLATRELALDNLMTLTQRDTLGYDPDNPRAGRGLSEWQRVVKERKPANKAR